MFLIINVATEFCALRQLHHEQNIETLTLRKTQKEDKLVANTAGWGRMTPKQGNWYCRRQEEKLILSWLCWSKYSSSFMISSCVIAWLYFSVFAFCWPWVIG